MCVGEFILNERRFSAREKGEIWVHKVNERYF